jgi:STE24 endopeptidase
MPTRSTLRNLICGALLAAAPLAAAANPPSAASGASTATAAAPRFSPEAATEAYLARLSPAARARSDAYFEGGYWLQLGGFLYGLAAAWLLLASGLAVRLRDLLERLTRSAFLRALLFGACYVLLIYLLTYPLTLYSDFFREHRYGLANQGFGPWMGDQTIGLALAASIGGVAIAVLHAVLRRAPRTWWIWGSGLAVAFLVVGAFVAPVWIEPLFNEITPLANPAVRDPILRLARANGIPAENVLVQDASKQSKRVSAHVTGLFGTLRIELNDNLLRRASPRTIEAVMGHEMGHYVLHHIPKSVLSFGLLIAVGFAFLARTAGGALARLGPRHRLRGLTDLAALPLLVALLSIYAFAVTPIANTLVRTDEGEADLFGLNAARQPDGEAEAALLLGEYRKLRPGPLEEWIFFDHPSGYHRILTAMRWKAEHLGDCDIAATAGNPMPAALPGETVTSAGAVSPEDQGCVVVARTFTRMTRSLRSATARKGGAASRGSVSRASRACRTKAGDMCPGRRKMTPV